MLLTGNSPFFRLQDGSLMEITKVYPLDAVYDTPEDVPEDVSEMFILKDTKTMHKIYHHLL
jgi:hypothetical protein